MESYLDEREEAGDEVARRSPAHSDRLRRSRAARNQLTDVARSFRGEPTESERLLWNELRRGRLQGYVFRRQHPIGPFIADFCCPLRSLIVEIDGPIHAEQRDADAERQRQLEARGYRVLRVSAAEVETRMADVLQAISTRLERA